MALEITGNQPKPEEKQSKFWALRMDFHVFLSGRVRVSTCLYLVSLLLTAWFFFSVREE